MSFYSVVNMIPHLTDAQLGYVEELVAFQKSRNEAEPPHQRRRTEPMLSAEHRQLVQQFVDISGCDGQQSRIQLQHYNWDLETSLAAFFDGNVAMEAAENGTFSVQEALAPPQLLFSHLDVSLQDRVLSYLTYKERIGSARTCSLWYQLSKSPNISKLRFTHLYRELGLEAASTPQRLLVSEKCGMISVLSDESMCLVSLQRLQVSPSSTLRNADQISFSNVVNWCVIPAKETVTSITYLLLCYGKAKPGITVQFVNPQETRTLLEHQAISDIDIWKDRKRGAWYVAAASLCSLTIYTFDLRKFSCTSLYTIDFESPIAKVNVFNGYIVVRLISGMVRVYQELLPLFDFSMTGRECACYHLDDRLILCDTSFTLHIISLPKDADPSLIGSVQLIGLPDLPQSVFLGSSSLHVVCASGVYWANFHSGQSQAELECLWKSHGGIACSFASLTSFYVVEDKCLKEYL